MADSAKRCDRDKSIWEGCGERIMKIRERRRITRAQLANLIDTDYHNLGEIERGEHGIRTDRLIRIAEVLNTSLDYLLLGRGEDFIDGTTVEKMNMIIMILRSFTDGQLDDVFEILCRLKNWVK
ncbi:XRE family transcriptional regulator [Butyricicoccus sp. 1XD8-22]|nr:XRE family transcriptional regulator [Butyricicoccus sp. 1XD8-22]